MNQFERPEVKIHPFAVVDILTTSMPTAATEVSTTGTPGELPGDDFE